MYMAEIHAKKLLTKNILTPNSESAALKKYTAH